MIFFFIIFALVVIQRIVELRIAKTNERFMKEKGAFEAGKSHYKWMVTLHVLFFISLFVEVITFHKTPAQWFWIPLCLFIISQVVRVWALQSLGRFWNTKIIVLPGAKVVAKGPYKYIRHPNYFIVMTEIITLPLIFQAYITAVVFAILNIIILSIRIPIEEKALAEATNYSHVMKSRSRFMPRDNSK
ncbi:methyltransferase [Scopulibacillus darangshiensis]|uniref:Methyltransferase n=1 Tax=Scopulibacillus darangshiensis TaxID=442528 RepID=A0A4R2NPX9_9BACL|nr:isoprenylcysteine carboxylmethyltransferase family protein [Scopulibacillus darangshiensis]TCP23817.1 methyltransferase [Scopulibacillus darangshiensis]